MSAAKNRAQVPAFTGCHCMRLRGVPLVRRSECGNVKMTPRFDTGRWCGGARLQCGRRGGRDWLYARTDRSQGHNRGINPLATWKCGRRGGRDWLYARTDRSQGHNRGINPLATWKCGRRGGERLRTTVVRTTRRSSLPGKVQVSASGDATVCGCSADDAEVVPPRESAGLRKRRRHGVRLQCF